MNSGQINVTDAFSAVVVEKSEALIKLCFKAALICECIHNMTQCSRVCSDLSSLQLFSGQLHQAADLGSDTEIFEEALVRRPELPPQRLPADQAQLISCTHEHLKRLCPLNTDSTCVS